jgi:hypothetical protein
MEIWNKIKMNHTETESGDLDFTELTQDRAERRSFTVSDILN